MMGTALSCWSALGPGLPVGTTACSLDTGSLASVHKARAQALSVWQGGGSDVSLPLHLVLQGAAGGADGAPCPTVPTLRDRPLPPAGMASDDQPLTSAGSAEALMPLCLRKCLLFTLVAL